MFFKVNYDKLTFVTKYRYIIGVGGKPLSFDPVKREAGARPARSRRCKGEVLFEAGHWENPGRHNRMMRPKPEDLPVVGTVGPRELG